MVGGCRPTALVPPAPQRANGLTCLEHDVHIATILNNMLLKIV